MPTVHEQIDAAISLLAGRSAVFSSQDVALHADSEGLADAIEHALRKRCTNNEILRLDESNSHTNTESRYLGVEVVQRWWVDSTIRWARAMAEFPQSLPRRWQTQLKPTTVNEIADCWKTGKFARWTLAQIYGLQRTTISDIASGNLEPETVNQIREWHGAGGWTEEMLSKGFGVRQSTVRDVLRVVAAELDQAVPKEDMQSEARHQAVIDFVTPDQLANAMSLAFDDCQWKTPPPTLLELGREWAMVADGCAPGTFVFPWVSLLRFYPQCTQLFRRSFASGLPCSWLDMSLNAAAKQALGYLDEREAGVIRMRFGIDTDSPSTLETVGKRYGVTRERIRQIEERANHKLRSRWCLHSCWLGIAADFVRSGGSLVVDKRSNTPSRRLLLNVLGLRTVHVKGLGIDLMTTIDLSEFRSRLSSDDEHRSPSSLLPFLSQSDGKRVRDAQKEYRKGKLTRPLMLREALRALGRAAHYQEIAEECNRLFPDAKATARNWHAALSWPASDDLDIVWVGRKGMYGLKEHGYSRPDTDLFDAVAQIVTEKFSERQRPVSSEVVFGELGKRRREVIRSSMMMALSFNDKLESVGRGEYVPKANAPSESSETLGSSYDIDAAFEAFSAEDADITTPRNLP